MGPDINQLPNDANLFLGLDGSITAAKGGVSVGIQANTTKSGSIQLFDDADELTVDMAGTGSADFKGSVTALNTPTAWVNFAGTSLVVRNSYNVTDITRQGTGSYRVNFTTPMDDPNYCVQVTSTAFISFIDAVTANYVDISTATADGTRGDVTIVCVAILGGRD